MSLFGKRTNISCREKLTLSSRISRRVGSGIAAEADIFVHVQCIITISYIKHQNIMKISSESQTPLQEAFIDDNIQVLASLTI